MRETLSAAKDWQILILLKRGKARSRSIQSELLDTRWLAGIALLALALHVRDTFKLFLFSSQRIWPNYLQYPSVM